MGLAGWLLFGHLAGVAVLCAGVGAFIAGLHMLASATGVDHVRLARPVLRWGEQLTLVGFGIVLVTGVGLGLNKSALLDAWLLVSVGLLAVIAGGGRVSGRRLDTLFAALDGSAAPPPGALLSMAGSVGIHLPADVTVVAIIEILYLMTLRPGWWGIAISLLVGALLVTGAAWALRRRVPTALAPASTESSPG